jgi:phosphonate transport system substrate-binding protein
MGQTDGFFGEVIEAGFHDRAIAMVAAGEVDASAIDSQVLAIAFRDDPSLAERIRVIDALGPSTIQPIAISRHVEPELRDAVRDAILALGDDATIRERLAVGFVERFVPVGPADYDDIRAMLDACERAGFLVLR